MNTWTEKGPGRKKCPAPGCNLYLGTRARICTCGHEFEKAATGSRRHSRFRKSDDDSDDPGPKHRVSKPLIVVPSGACPVELTATDPETVIEWAQAVRAACPTVSLSNGALRQYVRQFYPIRSDDYATAVRSLS